MAQKTEIEKNDQCSAFLEGKNSRIVIEDDKCKQFKEHEKPPIFIIGFAGVGLIGTIIANEMISQLKMEQIGYVISEDLPPITVFYDGILKHPFRIYYQSEYNIVISICEVPFNQGSYIDLARTLMNWAIQNGIEDVICLQGLADESMYISSFPSPVFAAAEKEVLDKVLSQGVKLPPRGLIMGAEAAILNECLNNKLNGIVYLTPANPQIPAPEGAASILEKISSVYGFPISLEGLSKQGNEIKQKLLELQKQTNKVHSLGSGGPQTNFYA